MRACYQIAGGSADGDIRVWDIANGQALALLRGHTADVESIDFSVVSHTVQ